MMLIADRTNDGALVKTALGDQIEAAYETLRDGGQSPNGRPFFRRGLRRRRRSATRLKGK